MSSSLQYSIELDIDYSAGVPAAFHQAIQTAIHTGTVQLKGEIALSTNIICPESERRMIRAEPFLK
jgi:hypothetical protein